MVLQLDHINGIHTDNRIENLRILCPNCHSQTPTFCARKLKIVNNCAECGCAIKKKSTRCQTCYQKVRLRIQKSEPTCVDCGCEKSTNKCPRCVDCAFQKSRRAERPPKEQLLAEIKELGYCGTGRKYGVTDNAIRKWLRSYPE